MDMPRVHTVGMDKRLLIGFDRSVPEGQATEEALEEWREYLDREQLVGVGVPATRVVHSPERDALDEYAVEVIGEIAE